MSRHTITAVVAAAALSSALSVTAIQTLNPPTATGSPHVSASVNASVKTVRQLKDIKLNLHEELDALKRINKTLKTGFADLHDQTGATNHKLDAADTELTDLRLKTGAISSNLIDFFHPGAFSSRSPWFELYSICKAVGGQNCLN
jgi:hypothetical protein